MLGAHSKIATVAEPWLLIPMLYSLRYEGVYAEYGHRVAARAIEGMTRTLPNGREDYLQAIADTAIGIYDQLAEPGTSVFLDKTPRYGLVVDELVSAFPDATFIVLHRSPLAVVASIVSTFLDGRWKPYHHKQDLYLLAERLLTAQRDNPEAFTVVRFEDVIKDPRRTLGRILDSLGLEWEDGVLTSFADVSVKGPVGDPTGIRDYQGLSREPLDKWREQLDSPVRQIWMKRYLRWLGHERLELMGYSLDDLLGQLNEAPTSNTRLVTDLADSAKGLLWSTFEVEIARDKLRELPSWHRVFTHN